MRRGECGLHCCYNAPLFGFLNTIEKVARYAHVMYGVVKSPFFLRRQAKSCVRYVMEMKRKMPVSASKHIFGGEEIIAIVALMYAGITFFIYIMPACNPSHAA